MADFRYVLCDVFTDRPLAGNQLAVFPDATGIAEEDLPRIAREFNFSETTFVFPPRDPAHTRRVRIFTPGSELPFAGHPTVGTAFVLATVGAILKWTHQVETLDVVVTHAGDAQILIRQVGSLEQAGAGQITFFNSKKLREKLGETRAAAVILSTRALLARCTACSER